MKSATSSSSRARIGRVVGLAALCALLPPMAAVRAKGAPEPGKLRLRASEAMAPCAEAAARAFAAASGRTSTLEVGPPDDATADVLLASSLEVTRAIEAGLALDETEAEIARVPWVLVLADRAPVVKTLEEAAKAGLEIELPAGPAASEARRAASSAAARTREARDTASLHKAEAALVPLSLAGPGRRIALRDVPPLAAHAAVGARAGSPEAGRAFASFLATERGRAAFAACGASGR